MADKYQILVEAVLDTGSDGKKIQTALNKVSSQVSLKIKNVEIDPKGMAQIRQQMKGLLSEFNVDYDALVGAGKKTGEALKKGLETSGFEESASAMMSRINQDKENIRKYYEGQGFQDIRIRETFDTEGLKDYQVQMRRIEGNYETISRGAVKVESETKQIVGNLKESSKYTTSVAEETQKWQDKLDKIISGSRDYIGKNKNAEGIVEDINEQLKVFDKSPEKVNKLKQSFSNLDVELKNTRDGIASVNKQGQSLSSMFSLALKKILMWGLGTSAIYGTIRQIKEAIAYVKELNVEMTNVQIVSGMTDQEIKSLASSYNDLAKQLGVTTVEVAKGSLEWVRQGKTAEETAKLLRASTMMATLGNLEQAQSTEYLTSIINGYGLSLEEVMPTIDKLVALDNAYATSVGEVAAALQRTANSAQQVGVPLDNVAAMITTVSSVTRKSAESIGESFKTIFSRMRDVKLNKDIDEAGESISDVEMILARFDIKLRDSSHQFRNMNDVLDDTMKKWVELGEAGKTVDQSTIAKAFAGVRQSEQFLTLMNNQEMYIEALKVEAEALGTTEERYEIYVDSVEAASNRLTTAWEKLASNTFRDEYIKRVIDLGTSFLEIVDDIGILNLAIFAFILGIPRLVAAINTIKISLLGLSAASGGAVYALIAIAGIVTGLIKRSQQLKQALRDSYAEFSESKRVVEENREELQRLADEYKSLAEKQNKNAEDIQRLLDIQGILNSKYDASTDGVNIYSDAINNNSKAIEENIEWMTKQAKAEAERFLTLEAAEYRKAKDFASSPPEAIAKLNEDGIYGNNMQEYLDYLAEAIGAGNDFSGQMRKEYDQLREELDAAEDLISEYERYADLIAGFDPLAMGKKWSYAGEDYEEGLNQILDGMEDTISDAEFIFEDLLKALVDVDRQLFSMMDTQEEFGEITTEQAQKLFDAFSDDELLGVLEMVGDQYILNAENLKLLIRQKANDLLITARENGATEQQIRLLEVYIEQLAKGLPFAAKAAEDANKDLEKAEQDRIKAMEDAQREQEKAYQDLLKATIDMIKQKKNAERDALKDQLDGYKKIIDAAKEVLDQKKAERDYDQKTKGQRKEITNIEEELFELQFDDSEEAAAKRLLLEEDLAEKKRNLNDTEYDRSVEVQKDALDEEYDRYEENINRKLEAIEAYLEQSGQIAQDAIAMIESRSDAFYQSLLAWNRIYGTGIDSDITGAWNRTFMAVGA